MSLSVSPRESIHLPLIYLRLLGWRLTFHQASPVYAASSPFHSAAKKRITVRADSVNNLVNQQLIQATCETNPTKVHLVQYHFVKETSQPVSHNSGTAQPVKHS